ncbi:MAG: ArsR family transcriptional regulator [Magnetococcales bacterium]|nr:ArsR family transcriptional regulator [Magnetococcales bacterium]
MGKSFGQRISEARRMYILQALKASADYRAGAPVIGEFLLSMGFGCSRIALRGELEWLRDLLLVELDDQHEALVARLTQEGLDVANGLLDVPGVRKMDP